MLAPLALHVGSVARVDNADTRMLIWNVAWVARTLAVDPLHLFDANIFYPHHGTLAYSETNIGAGLVAMPVYWATRNPVAAHNFAVLLSFVLSAVGAYYLVRRLTQDRRAAVVSAICFAYCPYVFAHLAHVHLLMTAGLPFALLAFHRLADRPTIGRGTVLGLVMGAETIFCGYYAAFVMLTIGFAVLVVACTRRWWLDRAYWAGVAAAAAAAGVLAALVFLPYLRLQRATGFARTLDEARMYSATWPTYLASSAHGHAWMLAIIRSWNEVLFPGFVALTFGVAGLWIGLRAAGRARETAVLYGGLGLAALWASFGPDAGLYWLLHATVPAFSLMRAPSRFGVIVMLALCVLAGLAIRSALGWIARTGSRGPTLARVAAATLGVVAVAELSTATSFSPVPPVEPAYRVLAAMPRGAVLEVPVYSAESAAERTWYMLSSTAHWMPLVNAYSSHIPDDFRAKRDVLGGFPSRDAFRLLEPDQVRYAVFHLDVFSPDIRGDVLRRIEAFGPWLRLLYADDRVRLYEIAAYPR